MSYLTHFSRVIHKARTEAGYTQQEVADGVSISLRWYQCIEEKARKPSAEVMMKILVFLKIDISVFEEDFKLVYPANKKIPEWKHKQSKT